MNFYTLSQTSLAKSGSGIVEEKIPLWFANGTNVNYINTSTSLSYLNDGSGQPSAESNTATKLFTLSASWSASQLFALEVTLYSQSASYTANAELWDVTLNSAVSASQVSTTSTAMNVIRSAQFTLIPGHTYGVAMWTSNSTSTYYITDASLIAFG